MKKDMKIISWWSGGVTSAITCLICIDLYGIDNCEFIFIDTKNEDADTYRFKKDCEKLYNKEIQTITGIGQGNHASGMYDSIEDVWMKHLSLNVSNGAICSYKLKRVVREKWEKENQFDCQAFGFDIDEPKRAKSIKMNHPQTKPIFPLMLMGLSKKDCLDILKDNFIEPPRMYKLGFHNNNCFGKSDTSIGGCVQGGIGYWQKIQREYPEKFKKMADLEHKLTDLKGKPVTMLREELKGEGRIMQTLFLIKHPKYPHLNDISSKKGREPKPLFECNGFCTSNDLEEKNPTQDEINYEQLTMFQQ